ncbi:MAG: WD40 repeat domain-containing protein [Cytophagaceae bacterium]|nr:WD40 repeat domain-containing protein [Cytophagaceae bacterium]MBK9510509.1 WD40 repeat domain-containing protein [Cytophagaceae bacterium]MBK9934461.1 WD40 repeat domain-containing protein [Cytophagaceae bacterium]MBL0300906.1 WD40 repeat domain-containing protein [Cytophagaceae bacterium]
MEFNIKKLQTFIGHKSSVYGLANGENSDVFYSVAGDGYVVRWDINNPDEGYPVVKLNNNAYTLNYFAAKNLLIVPDNQVGVHWVDVESRQIVHTNHLPGVSVFDIKTFDENVFFSDNKSNFHQVSTKDFSIKTHPAYSDKSARSMAILPISQEIAVAYSDFSIRIFDLNNLKLKKILSGHENSVFSLIFLEDKKLLVSAGRDAKIIVWDTENDFEKIEKIPAHIYAINHLEVLQEVGLIASCSMDKTIKLWDINDFKLKKVIDKGRHASHNSSINRILWNSESQQLLSASDDRNISLWNLF